MSQRPSFRQPNDAETLTNTYENRLKSCRLFAGVNAMNRTRDLHLPAWVPTAFRVPWDGHFWPDDHHVDLPTRQHSGSVTTHFDDRSVSEVCTHVFPKAKTSYESILIVAH